MFCKQCGNDLGENKVSFCPHCGVRLTDEVQEEGKDREHTAKKAGAKETESEGKEAQKEVIQDSQGIAARAVRSGARKRKQGRTKKKRRAILLGITATLIFAMAVIWVHDTSLYRTLKKDERITLLEEPWWNWIREAYYEENLVVAKVDQQGGIGVFRYDGQEVIPPVYRSIEINIESARILAASNSSIALFDFEGNVLKEINGLSSPSIYMMEEEGNIGYGSNTGFGGIMDINGNDILREVKSFEDLQVIEGICRRVYQKGGVFGETWGIVDETGTEIVPCQYEDIENYCDGVAVVRKDGLEGVIDLEGNEILSCQYEYVDNYRNGWARLRDQEGNIYFVDTQGNIVIDAKRGPWRQIYGCAGDDYISVGKNEETRFLVRRDEYYSGNTVVPDEYEAVYYAGEDMFRVCKDGKYGILTADGRLLVPCEYDDISWMDGWFLVYNENEDIVDDGGTYSIYKHGLLSASGEEILPVEYDYCNRGGQNGKDDYYVFSKEPKEGEDTQVMVSLAGEKIGEYMGNYQTVSLESKNGREERAYITGDQTFTLLGKDGQPWQQWKCNNYSIRKEYICLSLENGEDIVVSMRDGLQIGESKDGGITLYDDGFVAWNEEKGRQLFYSYSSWELWNWDPSKGGVNAWNNDLSLYFGNANNDRWLPFDLLPFSKSNYWFNLKR